MKTILRMTPGAVQDGLIYFRLGLWDGTEEVAHWAVGSGQAGAQHLRTYEDKLSLPGNMEPIPEGVYPISGPYWAGSPGDYETWWSNALGPVVWDLHCKGDSEAGYRGALRIHLDANRSYAAGSAGCPVLLTMTELKSFVKACLTYNPTEFVSDYGFGTVPGAPGKLSAAPLLKAEAPKVPAAFPTAIVKMGGQEIGQAAIIDGTTYASMSVVAALLGGTLDWDGKTKTLTVKI